MAGIATCLFAGFGVGVWASRLWPAVLLWMNRSPFGVVDPVHHLDVSFFVFDLPLLAAGADVVLAAVVIAGSIAVVVYVLSGAIRVSWPARMHLAVVGAAVLVVLALRLWLLTYSIEISRAAQPGLTGFPGADDVDVRVRIPAIRLACILIVLAAVALVVIVILAALGHVRVAVRVSAWQAAVTTGVMLLSLGVAPWAAQRLLVDPQPVAREQPELAGAIEATRRAFALDQVKVAAESAPARLPVAGVAAASADLANVQVWDGPVLAQQMRQLASAAPYFRVRTPSVDVIQSGGTKQLAAFAEQELDLQRVPGDGSGWADSHMVYTHAVGALCYLASEVGQHGQPVAENLSRALGDARIYFGNLAPQAPAWVVADTHRSEADTPGAATAYHYRGTGGIAFSSWLQRTVFAIRFGDLGLLLSTDITPQSRLIMHRDVIGRLTALASFIRWDPTTTAVPVGKRVIFVAYGYTTSDSYPQSEPVRLAGQLVNYARASVVATVDAYSGVTRLYLIDRTDPIARAWAAAFPGLFQPASALPESLRPNLRYPPAFFDAQAQLEQRFHVASPAIFASGADVWEGPTDLSGSATTIGNIRFGSSAVQNPDQLAPQYRLAQPPGSHGPATLLRTTVFTPRGGQNVVAELDGWMAGDGQLRLSLAVMPGGVVVPGPAQISRLTLTTPSITAALGLINKETTDLAQHSVDTVQFGAPRWQVVDGAVIQVQAVYLEASGGSVATMLGISTFANGTAVMARTLAQSLRGAAEPP
jgi:uncharacterized membrane protein (UPF0182 family)